MRVAPPYHPPNEPLSILHADDDILVLDKPSGLLSVPGREPKHRDSLATRAADEFPDAKIVHRLDMDTSGVMVLAQNAPAHRNLSRQFELRQTSKTYLALVAGAPPQATGAVDAPLICDWPNRPRQMVEYEIGKTALTRWKTLQTTPAVSLMELKPETGRSHQLRVHMAHIGCPILGDCFYAPDDTKQAAPRLMLHALELGFAHPASGKALSFCATAPKGFSVHD